MTTLPTTSKNIRLMTTDAQESTEEKRGGIDLNTVRFYYTTKGFTLADIYSHQEKYLAIPEFQRPDMEDRRFGPLLIDTVLRGIPIDAPFTYLDKWTRPVRYYILDGSQTLRALMRFKAEEFRTLTRGKYERYSPHSPLAPIEPNRRFSELSFELRNAFDEYVVPYIVAETKEPINFTDVLPLLAEQFRRRQIARKLTTGQTLWSYQSTVKSVAQRLTHHPFFRQVFTPKVNGYDKTRIRFTMCLYTIALAMRGATPQRLRSEELTHLTSGKFDILVTPELEGKCELLLSRAAHVFFGAGASASTDMIVIGQACLLLERAGFNLDDSARGCLAPWFTRAKSGRLTENWGNGFAKIPERFNQERFWQLQEPLLREQPGLVHATKQVYLPTLQAQ